MYCQLLWEFLQNGSRIGILLGSQKENNCSKRLSQKNALCDSLKYIKKQSKQKIRKIFGFIYTSESEYLNSQNKELLQKMKEFFILKHDIVLSY